MKQVQRTRTAQPTNATKTNTNVSKPTKKASAAPKPQTRISSPPKEVLVITDPLPPLPPPIPEPPKEEELKIDLDFPSLIHDDFEEFVAEPEENSFFKSSEPLIEGVTSAEEEQVALELIRNTPEYTAAWELELWKRQEKHTFVQHLKDKEKNHIQALKSEISTREEKHRKRLLEQRDMIEKVEKSLREKLSQMERREQKLVEVDQELKRRRTELESDHSRKLEDMKHVIKLAKEDCLHKIEMERTKSEELERLNKQQATRIETLEEQYRHLLEEYHEFRKQVSSSDQTMLQNQLNKLTLENTDLEKKLHEATRSKQNYKNLWKRTEAQVEAVKRNYEEKLDRIRDEKHADAFLHAPVQPIPYPQAYYSAPPVVQSTPSTQNDIVEVRQMIKDLIEQTQKSEQQPAVSPPKKKVSREKEEPKKEPSPPVSPTVSSPEVHQHTHTHKWNDMNSPENLEDRKKKVAQLLEKKRRYLQMGTYSEDDPLIQQLDALIKSVK
jgi:centrosomal protein CEP120